MSFILNGITIEQTGTDTDVTGTVSIAGVNGSTGNRQIDANGLILSVAGNLTIRESFLANRLSVKATGNATLGAIDVNGVVEPCSIYIQNTANFGFGGVGVEVDNGGSLTLNNSFVYFDNNNGGVAHFGAANKDVWVFNAINSEIITSQRSWNYLGGGGDIDGLTVRNTEAVFFQGSPNSTKNIKLIDTNFGFGIDNQVGITVTLSKSSTPFSLIQRDNNNFNLIDVQLINGLKTRGFLGASSGWNFLKTLTTKSVGDNAGVNTTKYVFDSNDNEILSSGLDANGESSNVVQWGRVSLNTVVNGTVLPSTDINTNNNSVHDAGEYKLPLKVSYVSYNGNLAVQQGINFDVTNESYIQDFGLAPNLPNDVLITEQDKAIVDGYTELDTPQKFYDRAKAFLVDNYAGEIATIVNRSGNTIDAGSYDININPNATNAFIFDGTTITIKANLFTGSIITTGTVTLQNGATINGGVIDSNGDSFISFSGVNSWVVYPSAIDRDNNTNAIESGSGNYRFTFAGVTTFYARVVKDGVVFLVEIPINEAGETIFALTAEALLSALPSATQIASAVWSDADSYNTGEKGEELRIAKVKANLASNLSA